MKTVAIIQARMSSERLPGKVLKPIIGVPMMKRIVLRAQKAKNVDEVIVATSTDVSDDELYQFCVRENINVYRGNLNNVLDRYYQCATQSKADIIVRLTGDNALIDPEIIDRSIQIFINAEDMDYLHYCDELPLGMCTETFSYSALERAHANTDNAECLEHVTLYMYRNKGAFSVLNYSDTSLSDHSELRWTMDTPQDYELIECIYSYFGRDHFGYNEILKAYEEHPEWKMINSDVKQKQPVFHCGQEDSDGN